MKRIHNTTKIVFACYAVLALALAAFRFNWIDTGNIAHLPQARYILASVGILATLIALPLFIKLKRLNTSSRLWAQFGCALINVVIYILTLETSSLLCAAVALCISITQTNSTGKENDTEE
jgi:hypothetical protein